MGVKPISLVKKWPATTMVILALLITYPIGIPLMFLLAPLEAGLGLREESLSMVVMKWGPTIAGFAVLAVLAGRRGFKVWLRQLLRWRVGAGYYLFIYMAAILLFAVSIALTIAFSSQSSPPFTLPNRTSSVLGSYLAEIAYITVSNGEETGWRFVLLGILLTRTRLFAASLIVGAAWVLWHLPMYLLAGGGLVMFAPFIFVGLGLSVILAWLYKETDSLLLPILFHGAVNATTYTFQNHWPRLNESIEALGPLSEWMYVLALGPIVAAVLVWRRQLFFGPVSFREGENWVESEGATGSPARGIPPGRAR